ncbi:hypothetical protein P7C73_g1604, partial [Tremellales sp. Uapishka_1]
MSRLNSVPKNDSPYQQQHSPKSFTYTEDDKSTAHMIATMENEPAVRQSEEYAFFESKKFKIVFVAMCLNVMLFALDQFIITVAVPQIVSEFDALDQVEWLNTAFFIPCAGAILVFTQIMTVASPRWVYIASIVIFEAGSAGAAHSMDMLIVGRAIAGLGGAGMWNATYLVGGELIPFEKRPSLFAMFGLSYIIASVMGPLVGGAFTDMSAHGWRWCFYLNLPIGGVTLGLLVLTMPNIRLLPPFSGARDDRPTWRKVLRIDWIGAVLTIAFVTCLGIGLQYGGITKNWNDPSVIVTLVLAPVFFIALLAWSYLIGERAMIPTVLLRRRHFSAGLWVSFFGYGITVVLLYYLSIFYEAVLNKSATRAGVLLLGLQLSMSPVIVIIGKVAERTGQAKVFIVMGTMLCAVASGLLTRIGRSTSIAEMVGYEVIVGVGLGMVLNLMVVLVQSDYLSEAHLVPHVTGVFNVSPTTKNGANVQFWGFIGRIVGMSVATSIFENKLRQGLRTITVLPEAVRDVIAESPDSIFDTALVPEVYRNVTLDIHSKSLDNVWWLILGFSIACLAAALSMRHLDLKALGEAAAQRRGQTSAQSYPMEEHSTDTVGKGQVHVLLNPSHSFYPPFVIRKMLVIPFLFFLITSIAFSDSATAIPHERRQIRRRSACAPNGTGTGGAVLLAASAATTGAFPASQHHPPGQWLEYSHSVAPTTTSLTLSSGTSFSFSSSTVARSSQIKSSSGSAASQSSNPDNGPAMIAISITGSKTSTISDSTTPEPTLQPPSTVVSSASASSSSLVSAAEQQEWIDAHNTARQRYGAGVVTWDTKLAAKAQKNAQLCTGAHSNAGENIADQSGGLTPAQAVQMWMNENCRSPGQSGGLTFKQRTTGTIRFTPAVWKATTKIGCFSATCTVGSIFHDVAYGTIYESTCEYDPAGNVVNAGQFAANVGTFGS